MSGKTWSLCLMSPEETEFIQIRGLTSIGGKLGSGILLPSLKYKEDYLVVSPTATGLSIHSLKSRKKSGNFQLSAGEHFRVLDLTVLLVPKEKHLGEEKEEDSLGRFADDVRVLVQKFSQPGDLKGAMEMLLETMLSSYEMDKGVVIASDSKGQFSLMADENVNRDDSWLSETLVQKTLREQKPTIVQNVIGSRLETSRSLMATGFMSVCAWPLSVRGEALGVLVIGSDRPHNGLSERQLWTAEAYVQLAALMLKFYNNDILLKKEVAALKGAVMQKDCPLATQHQPLLQTILLAQQVSDTPLSLLIQGETGVGKEVLAQWIHRTSSRSGGPFVAVNCSAIPKDLLESLLFGHRKGAFTGAVKDQKGKFEMANGGTLFLDEIGDLPDFLQAKLLRVLQEKIIEPLGATQGQSIDVRVLSATHMNLEEKVESGSFREDLFYRLAEVSLEIPPLRQRSDDIILIVHELFKALGSEKLFSPEALAWAQNQPWPGNVRQLKSSIQRAIAISPDDRIDIHHLQIGGPAGTKSSAAFGWLGGTSLDDAKSRFIMEKVKIALARNQNNKTRAAEALGITPRTLFRYLENGEG